MYLLYNESTDPAFNLALEEHLLSALDIEITMLWRNRRSVIIGRNQNTAQEVDTDFVRERDISVIRRLSGGGAVFHDLGNINFTIIRQSGENDFGGYEEFTRPVRDFLLTLGIDAELHGRNDILIDGKKFSGNAQAVKNGRILHHGTILYSADFAGLSGALKPPGLKLKSKAIASVRSRVTNVAEHLAAPIPVEDFLLRLYSFFRALPDMREYTLTPADIAAANRLRDEKYSSWEWNFGRSPAYDYENSERFQSGTVEVFVSGKGSVMEDVRIYGDFFGEREVSGLEEKLRGLRHDKSAIDAAIPETELNEYIHGITKEQFLGLFA